MTPNKTFQSNDMKALVRELEDRKDSLMQLKIQKEFILKDVLAFKEMGENEATHHKHLKEREQQLRNNNVQERDKFERLTAIRGTIKKGTIRQIVNFSEDQVEQFKESRNTKKVSLERKLQEHIENYTKTRPLVLKYHQKETFLAQLQVNKSNLLAERKSFKEKMEKEKQVGDLVFEQNVVEMAQHVLRYFSIVDKLKHPQKKIEKKTTKPLAKMTMPKHRLQKQSEPLPAQITSTQMPADDQTMTEASSSSKNQATIDTNEVVEGQAFNRNSLSRFGIRGKKGEEKKKQLKESVNKEPPKMPNVIKTTASNARDDIKQKVASQQSQPAMPSTSSLKAPAEEMNSSQKPKKGKVTFVDFESSGSSYEMDFSKDEGVSTSGFKSGGANMNDMSMDMDLENENEAQMNDGDEINVQMDDEEINFEQEIDDNDDQISNWTSLENPTTNNPRPISPTASKASSFDEEYPSSNNMFGKSSPDSKPMSNNQFDFNFEDMDEDDMSVLFK